MCCDGQLQDQKGQTGQLRLGLALYVMEGLGCTELAVGVDMGWEPPDKELRDRQIKGMSLW